MGELTEIPTQGEGIVYVYRSPGFIGQGVYYDIHVTDSEGNETIIGTLKNGGYLQYRSQPGEKEFWAETESKSSVTLDIEADKMYCIKGSVGIGFLVGRPHLGIVKNDICEQELKETQLSTE